MEKKRRRRVLVVTICSPRPMRAVQRARLWAITCTASQAPLAGKRPEGETLALEADHRRHAEIGETSSTAIADINRCLRELLREYNEQEREAINRHLDVLRDSLELKDDDVIRFVLGGSQSKHTAVNGLSDVDALAIINDSSLSGQSPEAIIRQMAERIRQRLPQTSVSTGDMAVTIKYSDGIAIQILPAIRTKSGVRIADPGTKQWSNVVHPERFAQKLTQVNQANGGRVIPTVKLQPGEWWPSHSNQAYERVGEPGNPQRP